MQRVVVFRNSLEIRYAFPSYISFTLADSLLRRLRTLCVRYALGVLRGDYKDREVFTGLIKAVVDAQDQMARGVGTQNFSYTPDVVQFSHFCATTSPEVYRFMQKYFQLRSHRSIQ